MSSSSDDSGSSSVLSLSCSVSSVESDVSEVSEHGSNQETIEPYRFEPEESDTPLDTEETEPGGAEDSDDDDDDSEGEERLLNRDWYACASYKNAHKQACNLFRCQCGNCVIMPTGRECVCCCEVESVVEKKEENHTDISCITDHEGFTPVCLDVWVLQTAYSNYRYRYGDPEEKHIHE